MFFRLEGYQFLFSIHSTNISRAPAMGQTLSDDLRYVVPTSWFINQQRNAGRTIEYNAKILVLLISFAHPS